MESFSAKQKMEMFPSVDAKSLAGSHGMVVSQSKLVDVSKQMKLDAFEASTVDAITKTNGAITVIVYILRDGNGSPVGAFSPQNPNVANAPISAVVASLGI